MYRSITFILVVLLLSSCAATVSYQKAVDSFLDSRPCCTSMSEFKYEPLPSGETVTFKLDENSESYVFPSGKSYFKAFHLPNMDLPYRIHIESFALGESVDKAHIFYPQVVFLADDFTIVKRSHPSEFRMRKAGLRETASLSWGLLPLKLEGSKFVDIPDARYLVIFTTQELMGSKTSQYMSQQIQPIPIPVSGGVLMGAVPAGKLPVYIPHSPFGWISIETEP